MTSLRVRPFHSRAAPLVRVPVTDGKPGVRAQNEIETWTQALKAYDEDDHAKALDLFGVRVCAEPRVPSSRVPENGPDPVAD